MRVISRSESVVPAVIVLLLFGGSLIPWQMKVQFGTIGAAHAPLHIGAFACAAVLVEVNARKSRVWNWLVLVVLGFVIEVVQWQLFRYGFEWLDVLYNTVGVAVGLALNYARQITNSEST